MQPYLTCPGATPLTISGRGFVNFQPLGGVQRCAFGYAAAAAAERPDGALVRQTTSAKVLSDELLVCPSFLVGAAGTVPFSVSLNGVDFITDATAQVQYKFYEQPAYIVGLEPTGGPRQGGTQAPALRVCA